MRDIELDVDIIRKGMSQCRSRNAGILGGLMLQDCATTVRLRGGDDDKPRQRKAIRPPINSTKTPAPKGKKTESGDADVLSKQLVWLRSARAKAAGLFGLQTGEGLLSELDALIETTDKLLDRVTSGRVFPKTDDPPASKTLATAAAIVKKIVKKYIPRLDKIVTTNLITTDDDDHSYYTTMVVASNAKIGKKIYPKYIVAVSETMWADTAKHPRIRYVSHLADIQVKFKPRAKWTTQAELEQITQAIVAQHAPVPSDGTRKIDRDAFDNIDGVIRSHIMPNGALKVQVRGDEKAIADNVLRYIADKVKETNPMYRGAITYRLMNVGKEKYVIFTAPMSGNRPKFSENTDIKRKLKVTASLSDVVSGLQI
jgi:hypothetical protein